MARLLIGHEVVVGVGEPWNFEGPDGPGRLQGKVVDVRGADDADQKQSVVIEVTPFESEEGVVITKLVAGGRYVEATSIIEQLAAGERAPANLSYRDQVPEDQRLPNVVPKLIGSVRLS
jgi:hypothetical protein